jgi:hypothetical protein
LESKVIPLLAGIIAFIDTNRNLDILTNKEEWKIDLWLQIFNDPELTQLKYSLIVSPSRQQELQEVAVKSTSMEVGQKRTTVCTHKYVDCLLKNISNKHNKYIVNKKLKHFNDISYSELFGKIRFIPNFFFFW